MGYSYSLWKNTQSRKDGAVRAERIQNITWLMILPLAVVQLATGFTMISINQEDLSQFWISGSVLGFVTVVFGWFSFVYLLLAAQQAEIQNTSDSAFEQSEQRGLYYRRLQSMMLSLCAIAMLMMIFFMANKVA